MDLGIAKKRVLITGASRGIGAEIARHFAKEGCQLSLIARDRKNLESVLKEIGNTDVGHDYLEINLRDPGAPTEAVKELLSRHESIDIIVHNLGGALGVKDPLADINDWLEVWRFNVGIAIEMNANLVPVMKKNKWGRIIHVSSINAVTGGAMVEPYGGSPAYSCAKAYLNMYIKVIGREMVKDNVIVSGVMPGTILSKGKYWDKLQKLNPQRVKEYLENHHAINRFGKAEEIAPFVLLLASTHASFAAGSLLNIDGGAL
jgi:NAD(P)-dependent dehydrogenase (short-subunit alcohol dehydrogenase family)